MFGFWESILSFLIRMVGLRTDAADAAGSLHAKVAEAKSSINSKIGVSTDTRVSDTIMGWLKTPIKSVQRGVTLLDTGTVSSSIAITSVDTGKASVAHLGVRSTNALSGLILIKLTNATTLTFERSDSTAAGYISWEVVESY